MSATGDAGATLIEALAVVAIVAAVSLIAFPRLEGMLMTIAQRQTAAMVEARLRQARGDAIDRDGPVLFLLAADGRGYGAAGGRPTPAAPGVTVTGGAVGRRTIAFFGDGSSSGGEVRIRAGRRVLTIGVAAADGAIGQTPG